MDSKRFYLLFLAIALILFIYTLLCVNETHVLVVNVGWENNVIEAKWLLYLIAGMGVCLWGFYHIFASALYTESLIYVHIITYFILCVLLVLWDNNSFSIKDAVDSNSFTSVHQVRSEYHEIQDWSSFYKSMFWMFLMLQPIGLVNLLLGFLRSNTK